MRAINEINTSYENVDRIEGNLMYLIGHPYPHKGIPNASAVDATNKVKQLLLSYLKRPWRAIFGLRALEDEATKILEPYANYDNEWTKATETFYYLVDEFLHQLGTRCRLALILSLVIEYDGAYRFRLQDLANETTTELLTTYPRKEVKRLLAIWAKRDHTVMRAKFKYMAYFLPYLLLVPSIKKAFVNAIKTVGIEGLKPDASDLYYMKLKTDYDYQGIRNPNRT